MIHLLKFVAPGSLLIALVLLCAASAASSAQSGDNTNQGHEKEVFTDEDLKKPIIGIANTWIETMPCNFNLRELAEHVKAGVRAAGRGSGRRPRPPRHSGRGAPPRRGRRARPARRRKPGP